MTKKQQWEANPEFRKELAGILTSSTMVLAIEVLREVELRLVTHSGNFDLVQFWALMGAKRTGYNEFLINLQDLSKTNPVPKNEPKAWDQLPAQPT